MAAAVHVCRLAPRRSVEADHEADPRWEATYANLKAAELEGERVELMAVEAGATLAWSLEPQRREPVPLARRGLRRYTAHEHRTPPGALLDELVDRTFIVSGSLETIGLVLPS